MFLSFLFTKRRTKVNLGGKGFLENLTWLNTNRNYTSLVGVSFDSHGWNVARRGEGVLV